MGLQGFTRVLHISSCHHVYYTHTGHTREDGVEEGGEEGRGDRETGKEKTCVIEEEIRMFGKCVCVCNLNSY